MFRNLVLLNALCLYASVTVYVPVIGASASVTDQTGMAGLNLFFMLSTALGILSFGFFRNKPALVSPRHYLMPALGVNAISVAALLLILTTGAGHMFRFAALFLFAATNGHVAGSLFYQISQYIPAARHGICIGAFLACSHFFMFLSETLVKTLGLSQNHSLFFLFPVLAAMTVLLRRNEPAKTPATGTPNLLIRRHAPVFLIAAALLSLTVGFSDSLFFTYHEQYSEWFRYTRFVNIGGFLLAGWLADTWPVYLPLTAVLAKTASLGFCVFVLEGGAMILSDIADCFFTTFLIVFLIWLFVTLAAHMPRAELWAGLGRIIELPCGAAGALLGVILLQHLPVSLTFFVYVLLLMLSAALFYQGLVIWNRTMNRQVILATVSGSRTERAAAEFESSPEPAVMMSLSPASPAAGYGSSVQPPIPVNTPPAVFPANAGESQNISQSPGQNAEECAETSIAKIPAMEQSSGKKVSVTDAGKNLTGKIVAAPMAGNTIHGSEAEESVPDFSSVSDLTPEQFDELLLRFKKFYHLTRRETEILSELLWERSIAEISEKLVVTPRTVKYHTSNLYQKTGVKNQKELKRTLRKQKKRFDAGLDVIPSDEEEG